jgi:uncharacterized protein (DUF2147 family)
MLNAVRRIVPALILFVLGMSAGVAPVAAAPIPLSSVMGSPADGTWRTQNGTEITIGPCEGGLCGSLTFITIPKKNAEQCRSMDKQSFAQLILDYGNPDKSLQTRPLLGLVMLTLKPTNDPSSFTARVYNPEDGSTNDVQVFIINNGTTLRIGGGCLGTMCVQSQDWPKVPARATAPDFSCDGGQ